MSEKTTVVMIILSPVFLALGILMVALFHLDIYLPIWASVLFLVLVSLFLVKGYLDKRIGMLMMVMWLVYALPFIHVVPYLWFDFAHEHPEVLWGLAVNPYMLDAQVVKLTAMIGAVGGMGFALGVSLDWRKRTRFEASARNNLSQARSLPVPFWMLWVVCGVLLSWLASPRETILTAAYTESQPLLDGANFGSAWMVSSGLLIFAFCDAMLDVCQSRRSLKIKWAVLAIAFVVVYLQLMHGKRNTISMVFALSLIYYYWTTPDSVKQGIHWPWVKLGLIGVFLVAASLVFGVLRSTVVGLNTEQFFTKLASLYASGSIGVSKIFYGTWSAVLLTPLSVAGDHIHGLLRLGLGWDYVEFLLSTPPGFLADAVGYSRPIDGLHGPAWEMRYGIGGTHAIVVPFLNFRMAGVLLVIAAWAYVLHASERLVLVRMTVGHLAFLGIMVTAAPHWLWYGEKNGISAVLIWLILWWGYRINLNFERVWEAGSSAGDKQRAALRCENP